MIICKEDPLGRAVVAAIHKGDVGAVKRLLDENPGLANARIGDPNVPVASQMTRTLLHVVADWPGHFPNGAAIVHVLADAGGDVNARFTGPHTETPLHWAASSDDVELLDALLDRGADLNWVGFDGLTPLDAAIRVGAEDLISWLRAGGAKTAAEYR